MDLSLGILLIIVGGALEGLFSLGVNLHQKYSRGSGMLGCRPRDDENGPTRA